MTDLIARVKVIATALVTWLLVGQGVVTAVLVGLEPFTDIAVVGNVLNYGTMVLGWIGTAIAIIRRVTEVPPELRGILVPPDPIPLGGIEASDQDFDEMVRALSE